MDVLFPDVARDKNGREGLLASEKRFAQWHEIMCARSGSKLPPHSLSMTLLYNNLRLSRSI